MNRQKASIEQIEYLVQYWQEHPEIDLNLYVRRDFKKYRSAWYTLIDILNTMTGPSKTWEQWRYSWHALKKKVMRKQKKNEQLNKFELKILDLIIRDIDAREALREEQTPTTPKMSPQLNDDQKELLLKFIENHTETKISWQDVSHALNTAEYNYDWVQWKKVWTEIKEDVLKNCLVKNESIDSCPQLNNFEQRVKTLIETRLSENAVEDWIAVPTVTLNDDQKERLLNYIENHTEVKISWDDVSSMLNTEEYSYDWKEIWTDIKKDILAKNIIKQENTESHQELNNFEQRVMKLVDNNDQYNNIKDEQSNSDADRQSISAEDDQDAKSSHTISTSLDQNDDENFELVIVINSDSEGETPTILDDATNPLNIEENSLSQCGTNSIDNSISTQEHQASRDNLNKNKRLRTNPLQLYRKLITSKKREKRISNLIDRQTEQLQRKSKLCSNYYVKKTKLLEKQLLYLERRTVAREQLYSKKILSMDRKISVLEADIAKRKKYVL